MPVLFIVVVLFVVVADHAAFFNPVVYYHVPPIKVDPPKIDPPPPQPQLNIALYNKLMEELANNPVAPSFVASTSAARASSTIVRQPTYLWPAHAAYPAYGAILPFNRVVAYYGNFLSPAMGILGQYPPQEMLTRLMNQVAQWKAADPATPVIPALDYIAVSAQGSPGPNGMYRLRMASSSIEEAIQLANQVHGLVILDVQVGWSTVEQEVPLLEPYLKLPNVELALDPEFALQPPKRPGTAIGSLDASDINFAARYLAHLVTQYNLPPKFLVVHRFTKSMVTNYQDITPLPQTEIVMDMDGFGTPAQKTKVYNEIIYPEPVQFAGIKIFYKNDVANGSHLMTPREILSLRPRPIFIQYQ